MLYSWAKAHGFRAGNFMDSFIDDLDDVNSRSMSSSAGMSQNFGFERSGGPYSANSQNDVGGVGSFSSSHVHIEQTKGENVPFYALDCEVRIREAFFPGDPYTYRMKCRLVFEHAAPNGVYTYAVTGTVTCPEFSLEDYLYLRKWHILYPIVADALEKKTIRLAIQPFNWCYTKKDTQDTAVPTDSVFKEKVRDAFSRYAKAHPTLLKNVKTAIFKFFESLDEEIKKVSDTEKSVNRPFKEAVGLKRKFGVYEKTHTSDILDYLFGDRYRLYNGEDVQLQEECLLIPNWWVKTTEEANFQKPRYLGYGMRLGIIEFGLTPYPWALLRINTIKNTIASAISESAAFGRTEKDVGNVGKRVFVAALRGGKMVFKKLSENYATQEGDPQKFDLLVSLAFGELEAEARGKENPAP